MPLEGGEPRPLVGEPGTVASGASVVGVTGSGRDLDADLVRRDRRRRPGRRRRGARTRHGLDRGIELFAREEREFTISDGTVVHGWLVRDPDAPRPQPLLLDIHGGPHNAWNGAADAIHLYHQELAARGWTVLLLNPRGSDGYGEDFYRRRSRTGARRTRRTSSSRSTPSSPRASPTRTGWPSPATATAGT